LCTGTGGVILGHSRGRNAGILKCRNAGIFECRNAGILKCRNAGILDQEGNLGGRYLSIKFRFHISDFRFQISDLRSQISQPLPQFLSSFLILSH
jgi:hypothetical protein